MMSFDEILELPVTERERRPAILEARNAELERELREMLVDEKTAVLQACIQDLEQQLAELRRSQSK